MSEDMSRFNNVPGLDPSMVGEEPLPLGVVVVSSRIGVGEMMGSIVVEGAGTKPIRVLASREDSLRLDLGDAYINQVVCEAPQRLSKTEPDSRGGIMYAGFGFDHASIFTMTSGGRLLADNRCVRYGGRNTLVRSQGLGFGDYEINRIAESADEATLVLKAIAGHMRLNEADGLLLAHVALDFDKLHYGKERL